MTKEEKRAYHKAYNQAYYKAHKGECRARDRQRRQRLREKARNPASDGRRRKEKPVVLIGTFGKGMTASDLMNAPAGKTERFLDDILKGRRFLTVRVDA